jgi:hypothetical protein
MRRTVTLEAGSFGREAVEDEARRLALSPEQLVSRAVRYYLADRAAGRVAHRVPSQLQSGGREGADNIALDLDLDLQTWRDLGAECRREDVSMDTLVSHAVLYLIADIDSGRVARRFVSEGGRREG